VRSITRIAVASFFCGVAFTARAQAPDGVRAPAQTAATPQTMRVFQLWIHDTSALAKDPRVLSLMKSLGTSIVTKPNEQEEALGAFRALGKGAEWPVEVDAYISLAPTQRFLLAAFYSSKTVDLLTELKKSDPKNSEKFKKTTWRGTPVDFYDRVGGNGPSKETRLASGPFNFGGFAFCKYQGKQLGLMYATHDPQESPEAAVLGALDALDAAAPLTTPLPDALKSQLKGRGVEFAIDMAGIVRDLPSEHPLRLMMDDFLGQGFAGLTYRIDVEGDHLVDEGFIDIRSGRGLLGSVLEPPAGPNRLDRWIPPCAEEFMAVRVSMPGLTKLARQAKKMGAPLDPAAWGPAAAPLQRMLGNRDLFQELETTLTGEVVFLSRPSAAVGADGPSTAWMIGMADGPAVLEGFRKAVAREGKSAGIEWGSVDPFGVRTVNHNSIPMIYVAAKPGFVAGALANDTSLQLLRAALLTEGKSNLTSDFAERMGRDAVSQPHTFLGIQHILSRIAGMSAMRAMRDQTVPLAFAAMTQVLGKGFGGDKGIFASTAVTTPAGTHFKSVW
jgi:hypothetical protein